MKRTANLLTGTVTNHNARWSSHEVETLRSMIKSGANSSQIAKTLGRTRASVLAKKSALGIEDTIVRGKNHSHLGVPMTIGKHKRRKPTDSAQTKIDFSAPTTKEAKKANKATKKAEKANRTGSTSIESLVAQLSGMAKAAGLKLSIKFEND